MHSRTIDVVTGWDTVAIPAGYEGLRKLADRGFSGAVSAAPAWAFFLNGRIVGVFEGGIEAFEDADATAYRAGDPSLPLLFAMQERGGDTRANYYTNETPLRDVDRTLSNGGFTGYVELSENVLSGDYYVVYHGGKSMSAAFVGSSERLVTGDEAFETAADEVGIYEVVDVDVELVDIPEPEPEPEPEPDPEPESAADGDDRSTGDGAAGAGGAAVADEPDAAGSEDRTSASTGAGASAASESESESEPGSAADAEPDRDPASAEPAGPPDAAATADAAPDDAGAGGEPESDADADSGPERAVGSEPEVDGRSDAAAAPDTAVEPDSGSDEAEREADAGAAAPDPIAEDGARSDDGTAAVAAAGTANGGPDAARTEEKRWRQARTIPSLDPGSTDGSVDDGDDREDTRERTARMQRQRKRQRATRERAGSDPAGDAAARSDAGADARSDRPDAAAVQTLRKRLSQARDRIDSLESERNDLRAEREELREERDAFRDERAERTDRIEELEAERDRLRSEVDRLQSRVDDDGAAAESMPADRALSGTNLFVRYDTKGKATLKHAHEGEASQSDVRENLRLEHHTTFETEGLTVDGRPYEEFLRESTEHAFAQWMVSDLLYEIGETGNRSELAGVFDAIPEIDRVEIRGEVGVETDDGVEQRSFDVVFRDRMGDPLFVADINPSRDATTEAMVGSLVENTHTVASEAETVAAGLYVTESFYEPGALETVSDRTGGGILSRSKKRSFVKLSRKRGYHLCLVEARGGEFHLNVPEL